MLHVIVPENAPVPTLFELNTKVTHPEVFPEVAETIEPCKSFPLYVPKLGAVI